jgi:uncharacterized protein (DUF4415 family)
MPAPKDRSYNPRDNIKEDQVLDVLDTSDVARKKIGRPRKSESEKYKSTHIRLHPMVLDWAKAEAERRGVGYQSVINETLLEMIVS